MDFFFDEGSNDVTEAKFISKQPKNDNGSTILRNVS